MARCPVLDRYERLYRGDVDDVDDLDDADPVSQDELRDLLADPAQVAEIEVRVKAGDVPACFVVLGACLAIGERERMKRRRA